MLTEIKGYQTHLHVHCFCTQQTAHTHTCTHVYSFMMCIHSHCCCKVGHTVYMHVYRCVSSASSGSLHSFKLPADFVVLIPSLTHNPLFTHACTFSLKNCQHSQLVVLHLQPAQGVCIVSSLPPSLWSSSHKGWLSHTRNPLFIHLISTLFDKSCV